MSGPTIQEGATWLGIIATIGGFFLWCWRQIKRKVDLMFAQMSSEPIAAVSKRLDDYVSDAVSEHKAIREEIAAAEGRAHADVQTIRQEVADIKAHMANAADLKRVADNVDRLVFHLLDKADR